MAYAVDEEQGLIIRQTQNLRRVKHHAAGLGFAGLLLVLEERGVGLADAGRAGELGARADHLGEALGGLQVADAEGDERAGVGDDGAGARVNPLDLAEILKNEQQSRIGGEIPHPFLDLGHVAQRGALIEDEGGLVRGHERLVASLGIEGAAEHHAQEGAVDRQLLLIDHDEERGAFGVELHHVEVGGAGDDAGRPVGGEELEGLVGVRDDRAQLVRVRRGA